MATTQTVDEKEATIFQLYRGNHREETDAKAALDIRWMIRESERDDDLEMASQTFERLYDQVGTDSVEVGTDDTDHDVLSTLWHGWNMGSGRERQSFIQAQTRSLEVGDIVELEGTLYMVAPLGWVEVDLL